LLASVAMAGTLGIAAKAAGPGTRAGAEVTRLKTISSRLSSKGASLIIEATDPVAYIATRPDPLTVVVDVRNALSDDVVNGVTSNAKSPIVAVQVEPSVESGPNGSRIRVALMQPVAYHVRSERNTIVIDFDKLSAKAAPYILPPATRAVDPLEALGLDGTRAPAAPAPAVVPVAQVLPPARPSAQATGSVTVRPSGGTN
jgi:hypothetical protein